MNRNRALWAVQGLLAVIFAYAGTMKLQIPPEFLDMMSPFPAAFVYAISVCEILGALGLILPGVTGIRRELTPLAAAGLVVIMIGATASNLALAGPQMALPTAVIGLLALAVVVGRRQALPSFTFGPQARPAAA